MTDHQAHTYFQVLLNRVFCQSQELARAGTIHRDGLFHKDVDALFDSVTKMHPAERRRRRKDRHVVRLKAVHRLSVSIKADEPAVLGHVHLVRVPLAQVLVAAGKTVLEDIRHSDELDRTILNRQRI
jgi:hypothetical protein